MFTLQRVMCPISLPDRTHALNDAMHSLTKNDNQPHSQTEIDCTYDDDYPNPNNALVTLLRVPVTPIKNTTTYVTPPSRYYMPATHRCRNKLVVPTGLVGQRSSIIFVENNKMNHIPPPPPPPEEAPVILSVHIPN